MAEVYNSSASISNNIRFVKQALSTGDKPISAPQEVQTKNRGPLMDAGPGGAIFLCYRFWSSTSAKAEAGIRPTFRSNSRPFFRNTTVGMLITPN